MQILHTVALLRLIDSTFRKLIYAYLFFSRFIFRGSRASLSFSICRITANWSSLMGPRVFISLISRHDWTIYHIVKLDRFIILLFVWRVNFPTCSNPWSSSEFFGIILSESLIENDSSPFCPFRVNVLYSNGVRGEYYLSSFTSIFTSPRHSMISR